MASLERAFATIVAAEFDQRRVTDTIEEGWELRGDPPTATDALLYLLTQVIDWDEFEVVRRARDCDDAVTRLAHAALSVLDRTLLRRELARALDTYIPAAVAEVSAQYARE